MKRRADPNHHTTADSSECPFCGQPRKRRVVEICGQTFPLGFEECLCPSAVAALKTAEAEERYKFELDAVDRHRKKIAASGIPVRFRCAVADIEPWLPLVRDNYSLLFNGIQGVGKTHLACAIGLALIDEMSVRFTSIGRIKSAILSHEMTDAELFQRLSKCGLLILDDLGKEKASEWVVELIYSVINTRYEDVRPVIITSNYTMEELIAHMTISEDDVTASAIVSRIYEMCGGAPVTLQGGDRRLNCAKWPNNRSLKQQLMVCS